MPIYEYQCDNCGVVEVEQKISEKPLTKCPECKKKGKSSPVKRIISAAAFHLKGSGWYKSDYKNGTGQKANDSSGAAEAPKTDKGEEKSSLKTAPCCSDCKCKE